METTRPERCLRTTRPVAQLVRGRRDWYRMENAAGAAEPDHLYIYDEIGFWGITASDFVRDLRTLKASSLVVHLNTPGGEVFDGIAIHTALREHPASIEVRVDSLAASIGSVIAMAGDRVLMARGSTLMIHDPFTLALGNAADLRKTAEVLDQFGDTIAGFYAERAGGSVREWRARMLDETWYDAQSAVDAGLADEVTGQASARNSWDLSVFRHPPQDLLATDDAAAREPTKREIERALRDAGLSQSQAKAFLARAWDEPARDDTPRDVAALLSLRDALRGAIPQE